MPRRRKEAWTIRELEILERHYRRLSAAEIQRQYLPHRTLNAIRNTAASIKAGKWRHREWDEGEIETLRAFYPREGANAAQRLKGRTPGSVRFKAQELGLSAQWSEQDIEALRRLYPSGGTQAVEEALPAKSRAAIRSQVKHLGIRYQRRKGDGTNSLAWSGEELERLRQHQDLRLGELCKLFPERSKVAIKTMRQRLRRGRSGTSDA